MNQNNIYVTKRNGTHELFDLDKIHRVLEWAVSGINNVSISEIELRANLQIYDKVPSGEIHELLIKSAAELISEHTPNYQYVAARLVNYKLRKEVYDQYEPIPLYDLVIQNVERGVYDSSILEKYTTDEFSKMNSIIRHERDDKFTYTAMEQFRGKYLVQDRKTKTIFETPQMAYMLIAATLFSDYESDKRMGYVECLYEAISNFYISLATPIMAGVRTPVKQYSSCVLIECGDSLDSINATASSIVKYISKRAGIGLGVGAIRSEGAHIGDGSVVHTGVVPFLKYFQAAVKSCSQGGVRGGAATVYYPAWHYEFESLIVLKNNKGVEETRIRHLDYGVQLNKLMYTRLLNGGNITLFSPDEVPDLLSAFYNDSERFEQLYVQYENDENVRKKTIPALELFSSILTERKDTGRIYISNVDHTNSHSSFISDLVPISQSNLCLTGDSKIDIILDGKEYLNTPIKDVIGIVKNGYSRIKVLSKNFNTNDIEYKLVTDGALMGKPKSLLEITDESTGKTIRCTHEHKIYTKNRGWVLAKCLKEDDELDIK